MDTAEDYPSSPDEMEESEDIGAAAGAGSTEAEAEAALRASERVSTDGIFNDALLKRFYATRFPYDLMWRWLSYSKPGDYFQRREFSFTLKDDVYIRYGSYKTKDELERGVMSRMPHKIDIGAVFTAPPDKHDTLSKDAFKPQERELVFDVDLTDYDGVRTCCSGAAICTRCWRFMVAAVKVMDAGLREDFGFQHILWVYSGRRGIHCWVCDESARELTDEARGAIVNYFSAIEGGGESNKRANVPLTTPLHPALSRALYILEDCFVEHVVPKSGQGLLCGEATEILGMCPPSIAEAVKRSWSSGKHKTEDPVARWQLLKDHVSKTLKQVKAMSDRLMLHRLIPTIVFTYTYPRLDVNVSKARNHLLKSPFCIHPKTGRVCVPFDASRIDEFDPRTVPTVQDAVEAEVGSASDPMAECLRVMEAFLAPLERVALHARKAAAEETAAFTNDW